MAKPLVSDALWVFLQPLLPPPKPRRRVHPGRLPRSDRDVLNGGQLTPAGRAARGETVAPSEAYAAYPSGVTPVVRSRRHRQHQ